MRLTFRTPYLRLPIYPTLGYKRPDVFRPLRRDTAHAIPHSQLSSPFYRYYSSPPAIMEASEPTNVNVPQQLVQHDGKDYNVVKEGKAYILNPAAESAASKATRRDLKDEDKSQSVFYNPIQQFNRDLSVLAIRAYGEHVLALNKLKAEKKKLASKKGKKRKREEENGNGNGEQQDQGVNEGAPADSENAPVSESHPEQNNASFTILDALSATGLRALRYASEIPFTTYVVANDLSSSAIRSMKTNIEYNGLDKRIKQNTGDARAYMYSLLNTPSTQSSAVHTGKFDVIDLDPYGTAAPFMDAAVLGVKDGGLLCVTCTDAGVWASNGYPEKAFALYGGVTLKGSHSHEGGLRLILHGLAMSAAKYGLSIEPLLSLSIDFYARVFVRVHRSPAEVKFASGNTMMVYNCDAGCGAWSTQPLTQTKQRLDKKGNPFYHYGYAQGPSAGTNCEHCGFKTHLGGPMWAGPLHNPHFIQKILDMLPDADRDVYHTVDRIQGMLTTALEEDLSLDAATDSTPEPPNATVEPTTPSEYSAIIPRVDPALREPHPFYFSLSSLAKVIHTSTIPADAFRGAIRSLGYRCTRSHAKPNTIRTNAPWDVIWEVMREWARQKSPIKEGALKPGTAGAAIMAKARENIAQPQDGGEDLLDRLRKEILSAVESGKDVTDVVTKVEAALYRSGSRQLLGKSVSEPQAAKPKGTGAQGTSATSTLEVVFDEALGKDESVAHTKKRLVRYQINPRANWGPLNRASGGK